MDHFNDIDLLCKELEIKFRAERPHTPGRLILWITKDFSGVYLWTDKPECGEEDKLYSGLDALCVDGEPFAELPTPYRGRISISVSGSEHLSH